MPNGYVCVYYSMLCGVDDYFFCLFDKKTVQLFAQFKNEVYLCTVIQRDTNDNELKNTGEMAEWSIAAVLKTAVQRCTRGSNPCLSAKL